ncbi:putative Glucose-6-phosphate isomerase 1, chloroplastic [Cocos nucifera]|uniref:Glucose-6-phosphate isomerase n=1 Tax=Cocos nucifera TaxID=13894 RepID=A0A8K0NBC3_COCNU|nr:putative Glucose-6-phosphate isomerase 1, chloroplastic [Cocos nucifera]
MASISGACSPSSSLRPRRSLFSSKSLCRDTISLPIGPSVRLRHARPPQSIADLSRSTDGTGAAAAPVEKKVGAIEKDPINLWHRYVDWLYQHKELGLYVDVSRIGFTDEFFERMEPRLQKAFQAMQDLEKGAIANPDEGRMVGHYWLRNPNLAPNSFLRLQIEKTLDAICKFADEIISAKIRFIDNTDPAGIDHQIAQLGPELASTLVIVISKSGGTPETRNGLLEVQKAFREAGLVFSKQGVAITQENSLLDNTARIEGWLARFPMFDWVGGRTSEMSAVGLLPAALQAIDIKEMLVGASLMDEATRTTVVKNNPAALLALCWYWASDGVGSKDMVVLPYKDSLLLFSRYLQQLVMESLGKEFDLDGNRVIIHKFSLIGM